MIVYLFQVKGLVAQLIKVKDVSTATALEVAAGNKVNIYDLRWLYIGGGGGGGGGFGGAVVKVLTSEVADSILSDSLPNPVLHSCEKS